MDVDFVCNTNNAEVMPFGDRQNVNVENLKIEKNVEQYEESEMEMVVELNKGNNPGERPVGGDKKNKIRRPKMKQNLGEKKEKRKRKLSGNVDNFKKIKRKKDDNLLVVNKCKTNKFCDVTDENENPECSTTATPLRPMDASPDLELNHSNLMELSSRKKLKTVSARKFKAVMNECRKSLNILTSFSSDLLLAMDNSLSILKEHNFLDNKLISVPTLIELIRLAIETKRNSEEPFMEQEKNFSEIILNMTKETNLKNPKAKRKILNSPCQKNQKVSSMQENNQINAVFTIEGFVTKELSGIQNTEKENMVDCETSQIFKCSEVEGHERGGKNFITNYFKKLEKSSEGKDKKDKFGFSSTKNDKSHDSELKDFTDSKRKELDELLENQNCETHYLVEKSLEHPSKAKRSSKRDNNDSNILDGTKIENNGEVKAVDGVDFQDLLLDISSSVVGKGIALSKSETVQKEYLNLTGKMKAKLLQFHDNRRPPYWGTWRRKSDEVKPRNPFGKDKALNYDMDSDEEWEEEEEPGESLRGSDDEKEPEEDYEVDNDFFVPHGYLSDDENPEKEKIPLELLEKQFSSELKQQSRKMTPVILGCYWLHNHSPAEVESAYRDLQLEKLKYVPWTSLPIEAKTDDKERKTENYSVSESITRIKKFRMKVTFPLNEVPSLIKIIHGSPQNGDELAKKFLNQRHSLQQSRENGKRSVLTKKCVLKKIKELASWQISQDRKKMCWLVPKETQKEFGTEIEAETTATNPQKCYIWKFIKKGDKTTGKPTQVSQNSNVCLDINSTTTKENEAKS